MNELESLLQIVVVIAATALPIVGAIRLVAGRDAHIDDLTRTDLPCPGGWQSSIAPELAPSAPLSP